MCFLTNTDCHGSYTDLLLCTESTKSTEGSGWRSQPHGLPRPWEGGGEGAGGISTFSVLISRIFYTEAPFLTNTELHGNHGRSWWRSQPHGLPRPWEGGGNHAVGGYSTIQLFNYSTVQLFCSSVIIGNGVAIKNLFNLNNLLNLREISLWYLRLNKTICGGGGG